MNPYELADEIKKQLKELPHLKPSKWDSFLIDVESMLRQQAHRITELEFQIRMNELKYLEKIEKLEEQLKQDESMRICSLINDTYQVVKNDEVLHQGSVESCECFIRVFNKG